MGTNRVEKIGVRERSREVRPFEARFSARESGPGQRSDQLGGYLFATLFLLRLMLWTDTMRVWPCRVRVTDTFRGM